jgi:predicted DNA-binding transcriptional regulator YafY
MNRIDRLFAILLLLQHKSRVRAQDLAATFEVSKRTIYRDITALYESGIPIISLPGEGYELMEGFYLPPLVFTDHEASALFLGAQLLRQQASGALVADAEHALTKLSVALPTERRRRVQALTNIIGFITPRERFNLDDPQLVSLQHAIQHRRVIHIRYHSYLRDELTEREVEPHRLYYSEGIWYVEGYCRLRQDTRGFRVSRIEHLAVLATTFEPHAHQPAIPAWTIVRVRFAAEVVRWVRERQHYAFQTEDALPNTQGIMMTYRVNQVSEIVPWILSWGASAEVVAPQELREQLRREAIKLAEMLT